MIANIRRRELMNRISKAGDRYGYGPNGFIALMNITNRKSIGDVSLVELENFCSEHGLSNNSEIQQDNYKDVF